VGHHTRTTRRASTGSARRRWAVAAGGTALFLGVSATTAPLVLAEEPPQQALQSVTVDLGTDGSVTALSSTRISRPEDAAQRDDDAGTTTETVALDPAQNAGDLPVRITTSWRHDGEVGTDLAALRGVSGRVQVDVTVQNTTVHPERFQYDAGGAPRDSYALVATPMTVVASATLPAGAGAGLVRPQPGATEPGTTNGVVSSDGAATTVQWATLLAPPRLSATTTFSLVQDATDFQLPELRLTVQPGLATDTSIASLVGTTFGGSAALVGSENNTIGLIADVNATLAEVVDSLQTVRETLVVNAGQVGEAATASLASTADSVDAASAAVLGNLRTLDASVGATVDATNGQAVGALQGSVQGVLDYFGTPPPDPAVAVPSGTCGTPAQATEQAPTLLGQLATVSRQLRELGAASGDCVEQLRGTLRDSIGDAAQCADPAVAPALLVCRLTTAGGSLVDLAADLSIDAQAVLDTLDQQAVQRVGAELGDVVGAVQQLQAAGATVAAAADAGASEDLLDALDRLGTLLDTATPGRDDLADRTADLAEELEQLADLADDRIDALRDDAGSVTAQLTRVAESICDLDLAAGTTAAEQAADLRLLVDGSTCDPATVPPTPPVTDTGDPDFRTPLTARVTEDVQAWEDVLASVDAAAAGSNPDGAAARLAAVRTALGDVQDDVDLVGRLAGGGTKADGALADAVADLTDTLDALYDGSLGEFRCGDVLAPGAPALNALAGEFGALDCDQDDLATRLTALLQGAADQIRTQGVDDVTGAARAAAAAGSAADEQLSGLSQALLTELGSAADRQAEQGEAVVATQRARLAATQAAAAQDLDASAQEAVGRLAEQVAAASGQQTAASAALQAQLQKVLIDLGSASQGRGLLGVMQDSAGQAGVRTEQVQATSSAAAAFRGVRLTELADAQLEQQQLTRSLQSAQQFPSFGDDLPDGSTSSSVFVFRIGGGS
jgi:hypothetical protein